MNAVVGTRVYPKVTYHGHTFVPRGSNYRKDQEKIDSYHCGIEATWSGYHSAAFEGLDFFDITLEPLNGTVTCGCKYFAQIKLKSRDLQLRILSPFVHLRFLSV